MSAGAAMVEAYNCETAASQAILVCSFSFNLCTGRVFLDAKKL